MMENEIRTSIKTVYGMLWDVIALYEKTGCYNKVPEGEGDIWEFMGEKLMQVRKEINTLFLGNGEIQEKLTLLTDETEQFVRSYEVPGVVKRWKRINPRILFFDCAFDLKDECPDQFREICWGFTDFQLSCYPDENLAAARKRYFAETKKKIEERNLRYSKERVFQDELLRTLTLVFEHDLKGYLSCK